MDDNSTVMVEQTIILSDHALRQMQERGVSRDEVEDAIRMGERIPAKRGRLSFRRNFKFNRCWGGKHYAIKQVVPIVVKAETDMIVVTVYAFYF